MPRPITATLHVSALAHNLAVVRRQAPQSKVWAIIKANAYGHGLARVFRGLQDADGFGLLDLEEAIQLRELGWAGPILLLEGFFHPADLVLIDKYRLTVTVHSDEQLCMLEQARLTQPIDIYLKMNSGMNRLGYCPDRFKTSWQRARACASVKNITLMTHFADADQALGIESQLAYFERGVQGIPGERSLANSAAVLWHAQTQADWIRPGVILYGASPSGCAQALAPYGLRPAMTLASKIIAIQQLQAGDTVGYGSLYRTPSAMRLGVVACGYADGYPLLYTPHGTPVLVDGVKTRTVGKISMDMMTVDLTAIPHAGIGTPVELWGQNLPLDDVAQAASTLGYELMCALSSRVPVNIEETAATQCAAPISSGQKAR